MKKLFTIAFVLFSFISFSQSPVNNIDTLRLHAFAAFDEQNYLEAEKRLTALMETQGNETDWLLKRGIAALNNGKTATAKADFEEVEKTKAGMATYYLARCYAVEGNTTEALRYLEEHLKSKYKLPKSMLKLDADFKELSKKEQWTELWKKEWYNRYEYDLSEASYLIKSKKYYDAYEILDPMLLRGSKKHEAFYLRAEALIENRDFKTALKDIKSAAKIKPSELLYVEQMATLYETMGKKRKALKTYTVLIERNPYRIDYYMSRAKLNELFKHYDEAVADVNLYTSYFVNDADALYIAGNCYFKKSDYLTALTYYNKTIENDQTSANFYYARGMAYLNTETYKYAASDFSMALDLYPNNPEVYFNRGVARIELGDQKGACYDFRRADELGYLPVYDYIKQYCLNFDTK